MCAWGSAVPLRVPVPGYLSSSGWRQWKEKAVDGCIAPIVKALNAGGVYTIASCCGHGERLGEIMLEDGRRIVVVPAGVEDLDRILNRVRSERECELTSKVEALAAALAAKGGEDE